METVFRDLCRLYENSDILLSFHDEPTLRRRRQFVFAVLTLGSIGLSECSSLLIFIVAIRAVKKAGARFKKYTIFPMCSPKLQLSSS